MTPKGCYQPICQLCFVSPSEGQMSEAILFGCEFLILTVSGQHAGRVQGGNYVSLELLLFFPGHGEQGPAGCPFS